MNTEELDLEIEVLKRYPIGTIVMCLSCGEKRTIAGNNNACKNFDGYWMVSHSNSNPLVFKNGTWAKVFSYPEGYIPVGEIISDYQIF